MGKNKRGNNKKSKNDQEQFEGSLYDFLMHDEDFLAAFANSDITIAIVSAGEISQPFQLLNNNDKNIKSNLDQFNAIFKKRKQAYEVLCSIEAVNGKNSDAYKNQLQLIESIRDELMVPLEELRKEPGQAAFMAKNYSGNPFLMNESMAILISDLCLHDRQSLSYYGDAVCEVMNALHLRRLIATIEEEIANTDDSKMQDFLMEIKNNYLCTNIELEGWYLHQGMFMEGQLLGVDEDPDPVAIAFLDMEKDDYFDLKEAVYDGMCQASLEQYIDASTPKDGKPIDKYHKYATELCLGALLSLGDSDLVSTYLDMASSKTEDEAKSLRKITERAVNIGNKKESE